MLNSYLKVFYIIHGRIRGQHKKIDSQHIDQEIQSHSLFFHPQSPSLKAVGNCSSLKPQLRLHMVVTKVFPSQMPPWTSTFFRIPTRSSSYSDNYVDWLPYPQKCRRWYSCQVEVLGAGPFAAIPMVFIKDTYGILQHNPWPFPQLTRQCASNKTIYLQNPM